MTKKLYTLTDEHRAQFEPWRDKWIANALRCGPYSDKEKARAVEAVRAYYAAAGLKAPENIVFCASPISAAIAASIASGVWWLRENPQKHRELFGRELSEAEILHARDNAVRVATGGKPLPFVKPSKAVEKATRAATDDATRAATYAATRAATRAATDAAPTRFLVGCCSRWANFWQGGNHWSGYTAYLSFFRHIAKLGIDYTKFAPFEELAAFGPRFVHARFVIISELPDFIHRDDRNRPHCETGPFCRWRDGRELFYWHGTKVPGEWITNRATLDPALALTWENIEQRRAAAEIIGWKRVLEKVGARVVNADKDPEIGELLECDLPAAAGSRFLKVRCGTGREFVLSVPREMRTALEANAWTYGLEPNEYKPEVRT